MAISPRVRNALVFGAKVVVATVLITWLVRGGALDFGKLGMLVVRPSLFAMTLAVFAASVITSALRWRILLRLAGVELPLGRAMQLQMTALFFNVVIPGNVGGDVVKALYVARDADREKRTTILLIVFAERLLGLGGLVTLALLVIVGRGPALFANPLLRPMATIVALLGLGTVLGPALFVWLIKRHGERVEKWTTGSSRLARLLTQLVGALRLLSARPTSLLSALALSMASHAVAMAFFTALTNAISGPATYSTIATVFPIGLLTIVLPISPAGLGVGHVAFDRLYAAIGLTGGATVFNLFIVGYMATSMIGVIPYLTLRRSGALPSASDGLQ